MGEKYRETGKDHGLTKSKKRDKKIKKRKSFSFFTKKSEKEFFRVLPNTKGNIIFSNDRKKVTKIDKSLTKKKSPKKSQKQIIK